MINYDGEQYLTATEVAQRFTISRGTCYNNILQQVPKCYLPGRKHPLYKQSEVEQFSTIRVETVPCSLLPASTETAETGSKVHQ